MPCRILKHCHLPCVLTAMCRHQTYIQPVICRCSSWSVMNSVSIAWQRMVQRLATWGFRIVTLGIQVRLDITQKPKTNSRQARPELCKVNALNKNTRSAANQFHVCVSYIRYYIDKVPVILHGNLQRQCHKPYGHPTSVTWLQLLRQRHFQLSDCRITPTNALTISRTLPASDNSLGSLTLPDWN